MILMQYQQSKNQRAFEGEILQGLLFCQEMEEVLCLENLSVLVLILDAQT